VDARLARPSEAPRCRCGRRSIAGRARTACLAQDGNRARARSKISRLNSCRNWIAYMATEEVDFRFADLDGWSLTAAMEAMWEGQLAAVAAIGPALPAIAAATEAAKAALG